MIQVTFINLQKIIYQMGSEQSNTDSDSKRQQEAQAAALKQKKIQQEKTNKKIQIEKVTVDLDKNMEDFQNKERKLQAKIDVLKQKAKQLLAEGKEKEARKVLEEATRTKKQLQKIQVRRKLIATKKDELQTHGMNQQVIQAMEEANNLTKEDLASKLEQHMIAAKENRAIQDEINNRMKEMVENSQDEEATDDLMKELEREVVADKKKNIAKKDPLIGVETHNASLNKNKNNKNDDIESMLANL